MHYDVFAVGNALVDIQVQVEDSLIESLGFHRGAMTLVDEHTQIQVLSSIQGHRVTRCAGGSAANTVVGLAEFGGRAAYAGKVAGDDLGEFWLEDIRQLGITIEVPTCTGQSGACVVLISPDAQRTMLTHLGVSSQLGPDDIREHELRRAKYLYVEGYLFTGESTKAAAMRAIELAKLHGVKVAFTVSDPFLIQLYRDEFRKLIAGPVDLLFCNLDEARALTGKTDPVDCAQELHHLAADVALTLGGDGSLLMHNNQVFPIEPHPVTPVDSTGAGDMYAAGVLYGLTHGMSWKQSGHLASQAAARVVSQLGARLQRKFTPTEVQSFLSY